MTLTPPFLKSTLRDGILHLVLSRPERRNALSIGMLGALNAELAASAEDENVRVIVLSAEGPVFCAGHDLKELTQARDAGDGGQGFFRETFAECEKLMLAIAEGPKPVVAEVQGMATAAGCQLVAACDIAIASTTARFATPGVNIGLFCTTPSVPLLRTVGSKKARQMLFTGDAISAEEALAAGLISEVADSSTLSDRVRTVAMAIASKPSAIVRMGKQALSKLENLPLREAYAAATQIMVTNLGLPEARSGIAGFLGHSSSKSLK